jgi:hypothetical protein
MSEEKITYLLGAGASAQVLPLIRPNSESGNVGLSVALENFIFEYKGKIKANSKWNDVELGKLADIVKKCKTFGTPDLAAKNYLEIGDQANYLMLKLLLSHYFQDKQDSPNVTGSGYEGQNLDPRVVPFLTTISNKGKLPEGMKIISWNYDTQLEMGAVKLRPVGGTMNDFSTQFHVWPHNKTDAHQVDKDYFLLHLNGICGSLYSEFHLGIGNPFPFDFTRPSDTLLSFAWEDDRSFKKELFTEKRIELAKKMIAKTTILVVIGYSFPFFNRKIDAELFSAMKNSLRKIYFQDPKLNGQFLYSQFGLHKDSRDLMGDPGGKIVEIEHIADKSQYYVPFEL